MMLADVLAFFSAGVLAVLIRSAIGDGLEPANYLPFLPGLLLFVGIFTMVGLYPGVALHPVEELRRIVNATSFTYLIVVGVTFLLKQSAAYSRATFVVAWMMSIALVLVFRALARTLCCDKPWWGFPTVVLGSGDHADVIVRTLKRHRTLGLKPIAILDEHPAPQSRLTDDYIRGDLSLAETLSRSQRVRYGIIAMPTLSGRELCSWINRYAHGFDYLIVIPDLAGLSSLWVTALDLGGVLGLEVSQTLIHRAPRILKRVSDLSIAILLGVFLAPLFAVLALAVRLTSRGPVFYAQRRIGLHSQPFLAWKFRTMVSHADAVLQQHLDRDPALRAEWERDHKLRNDPRMTKIGKFLRKTSLDELPQFWNVLRGEMSVVGPRPIVEAEKPRYGDKFDLYRRVRPGITGLWQVSGRNDTTYRERVLYDDYYVRNWSVWLDFYILVRTIRTVVLAEGAY